MWPPSLGFVQADELGHLSKALTDVFLPARATVLRKFIDAHCSAPPGAVEGGSEDGLTLGGSAVGAAN